MTKKVKIGIAVGAVCALVIATAVVATPIVKERQLDAEAREIVTELSTEQKIGQVLLMDFRYWAREADGKLAPLTQCNDMVREWIAKYQLGNVILFGENVKTTENAVRFVADLQAASLAGGGMPLLVGIDQEGGIVTRLGQGTCLPGNMALGAAGKPKYARQAGDVIGEELAAIGIHCNFAPSCDVNNNPQNPVINLRSFSSDPALVAKLAPAFQQGLNNNRVIASAKHFPGHGNTSVDTHVGLAVLDKSKEEWDAVEAVPFRTMIADGADMMMTAHIQYPQIETTRYRSKLTGEEIYLPATLSHKFLTEILRDELGFKGVAVTDAMDMKAITDNFGESEACVMALAAGVDLLCVPTQLTSAEDEGKLARLYADIKTALTDGRLSPARLDEATERVIRLKLKYGILEESQYEIPVEEQIANAQKIVGSAAHREIERKLANAAITYRGEQPYVPMTLAEGETVLFLVPYESGGYSAQYAVNRLTQEGKIPKINVQTYVYEKDTAVSDELSAKMLAADHVVIVSMTTSHSLGDPENPEIKMPLLLAHTVQAGGKAADTAIISIGLPNDANSFPGLPLYLAYGYQAMTEEDAATGVITAKYGPNLPAAIDCLFGEFQPTGTLPVSMTGR